MQTPRDKKGFLINQGSQKLEGLSTDLCLPLYYILSCMIQQ
ncbi:hypothetical protein M077_0849 [Bacteroides fragilis str. 2-F-2 |nr:hypothetical protein M077_0849 [Bacteroides fragilis str. 2-F-2 \